MKTVLTIDGMMCGNCAKRVSNVIQNTGAQNIVVSLENKTAEFDFDPNTLSLDKIKSSIEDAGYDVL